MMSTPERHEQSLGAAIEDYLTRLENGEKPDTGEYLARYPECADGLKRFFNDLAFVDDKFAQQKAASRDSGLGLWFVQNRPFRGWEADADSIRADLPRIRGFHVLEELGGGSQGVVYKAVQLGTKRMVALKIIREGAFATRAERRRFENEVELASRLSHPNIVAVYSCGQDAGRDYYAMEFVQGQPLDVYLATKTLDIPATLELFLQICEAVGCAHRHGIIHRDLKPSNVIVDPLDRARIVDFGLAKSRLQGMETSHVAATQVGEFAGTWYYASPEQARKDPGLVDVRTDVYALGVILYEMLTDCLPYPIRDESRDTIARHILETPPPRPSTIRREVDDELDTIVLRALSKEVERRYQSVAALGEDVRRYMAGEAIEAKGDSSWYVLRKFVARHRWQVSALIVSLTVLLAFTVTISILYSKAVTARATTEVRSQVVRHSQRYIMERLDEYNWAMNRLTEIAAAHPDLAEVRALKKNVLGHPDTLIDPIVDDMPEGLFEAVLNTNHPEHGAAVQWLDRHERELSEIEQLTRNTRFVFELTPTSSTGFALTSDPGPLGRTVKLCEALSAQASHLCRRGNHAAAVAHLEAARSLALDLADGRMFFHKVVSIRGRARTYDAIVRVFSELAPESVHIDRYVAWAFRDPPLAAYRPALLAARHNRSQLVEAASCGRSIGGPGFVDLDALDRHSLGLYGIVEALTPELRTLAHSLRPEQMLEALDSYMCEVEEWDDVPLDVLKERAAAVSAKLRTHPALPLCEPLLSSYFDAYMMRGRVRAKRAATILAAHVCQHRAATGQWPDALDDALPQDAGVDTLDPYLGVPFGYTPRDGIPHLYSLNEDYTDNDAKVGAWGDPGTDVVFFVGRRD